MMTRLFRLAALGLCLLPSAASAATLTVPAQYANIQAAVNAAVNGDTVLIADGVYTGPGNVDIDFGGKNLTVASQHGASKTAIDCGGSSAANHRGFYLHRGERGVVISGLTIQHGYEGSATTSANGGGILLSGVSATVQNCTLIANTSTYGGGVYNDHNPDTTGDFAITLTGCAVTGNQAFVGGGICTNNTFGGTITMTGCTVTENMSRSDGGGVLNNNTYGGAITMTGCAIEGNTGQNAGGGGGGVSNGNNGGTITMTGCTVTGNTTNGGGGGVSNANVNGMITMTGCAIEGNTASGGGEGGGVLNSASGGPVTLTNCILSGNTAGGAGGGAGNRLSYAGNSDAGPITLANCTLEGNAAPSGMGGGVFNESAPVGERGVKPGGSITLLNDILAADQGGEIASDPNNTSPLTVTYCDVQGGYSGTGNFSADPRFVNPAGGDYHLQPGSPCLGAGIANDFDAIDRDGLVRPLPPSIGAYENPAKTIRTHILWNNADGQASLWGVRADGSFESRAYGPFADWTAKAISEGSDGIVHLLWDHTDGQISLWSVTPSGFTQTQFGPSPGYTAVSLSTGGAGTSYLLWDKTDGTASLWNVDTTDGSAEYLINNAEFGPFPGWTANAVASGQTVTDLLWTNTNGMMAGYRFAIDAGYRFAPAGSLTTQIFGPFNGWGAYALSVGPDDEAHPLWDNQDGRLSLWSADFLGSPVASTVYGPYSGWYGQAVATGPDNVTHLLWNHKLDGQASLWNIAGGAATAVEYGPYSGWKAVAVSAGP